MEYIDRSVAIRDICEWATNLNNPKMLVREDVIGILENIPAADVRPVVRGRWKPRDLTWWRSYYYCSACEETVDMPTAMGIPMFNYCPNCGAMMRYANCTETTTADEEREVLNVRDWLKNGAKMEES